MQATEDASLGSDKNSYQNICRNLEIKYSYLDAFTTLKEEGKSDLMKKDRLEGRKRWCNFSCNFSAPFCVSRLMLWQCLKIRLCPRRSQFKTFWNFLTYRRSKKICKRHTRMGRLQYRAWHKDRGGWWCRDFWFSKECSKDCPDSILENVSFREDIPRDANESIDAPDEPDMLEWGFKTSKPGR